MGKLGAITETREINKIPVTRIYGSKCCRMIIDKKTSEIQVLLRDESGITETMIDGTDRELILLYGEKELEASVKEKSLVFPDHMKADCLCIAMADAKAEAEPVEEQIKE